MHLSVISLLMTLLFLEVLQNVWSLLVISSTKYTHLCIDMIKKFHKAADRTVFKPPPPVGAGGGYMFSGRPSVPLSVRP